MEEVAFQHLLGHLDSYTFFTFIKKKKIYYIRLLARW